MGLSEQPGEVYSIASRIVCGKCHVTPKLSATGNDPIFIKAECHGETEERAIAKKELVFTQVFFKQEE